MSREVGSATLSGRGAIRRRWITAAPSGPRPAPPDPAPTTPATATTARFLRMNVGWILFVALIVTNGAAFLSWSRAPMYRSKVDVLVEPRVAPQQISAPQPPAMGTEKAVSTSGIVIAMAAEDLHAPGSELSNHVSVKVPLETSVLQISYSDPSPEEARRRAQGIADSYIGFRSPTTTAASQRGTSKTSALIDTVKAEVITPASLPSSPSSPNHIIDVSVGALIGLSLGVGTAALRDRLDDGLRGPSDLEAQTGIPVLALISATRTRRRDQTGALVMVRSPKSPAADSYRNLRTRVLLAAKRRGSRTLLVTSPVGGSPACVAANLAVALAQSGREVILVCADLRLGTTHELFGVDNHIGLTSVVEGRAALDDALQGTEVPGLLLLTAGRAIADPGAILHSAVLPSLLTQLRERAGMVVIDGPPLLANADAGALADLAEMTIITGDARRSSRGQVRAAAQVIGDVRGQLVGCVLTNVGRPGRARKRGRHEVTLNELPGETDEPSGPVPSGRYDEASSA